MPQRVLSAELPAHVGETVLLHGWVHRRRILKSVSFLIVRDRAGPRPGGRAGRPRRAARGDGRRRHRPGRREPDRARRRGGGRAGDHRGLGRRPNRRRSSCSGPSCAPACRPNSTPPRWRSGTRRAGPALAASAAAPCAASGRRSKRSASPRSSRRSSWPRRRRAARTCSPVDYFGRPAYLAQSPQFYKQLMVGVFERVYEVGPVFRAEPHDTGRHLAQYTSLDAELGFIADHRDVMAVSGRRVAGMVAATGVGAGRPGRDPGRAFRGRPADRGRRPRRTRPRARGRARGGGVGGAGARQRVRVRHRLPDGQAAVLHPSRTRARTRAGPTASTCCFAAWRS